MDLLGGPDEEPLPRDVRRAGADLLAAVANAAGGIEVAQEVGWRVAWRRRRTS